MRGARRSSREWLGLCIVSILAIGSGCEALRKSALLTNHMSADPRSEAQQRWDGIRGGVKLKIAEQHFNAHRLKEAEKVLREVMAMSRNSPEVFKLATRLYLEQGRLAQAKEAVQTAAMLDGVDGETAYLEGIVAQRFGDLQTALDHYIAAYDISPHVDEYLLAAAEMKMALGDPAAALELVAPRVKDFEGSAAVRMFAAKVCQTLGLRGPAVEHAREVLPLQPDDAMTRMEVGRILVWAEQYAEAIGVLRPLVENARNARTDPKDEKSKQMAHTVRAAARALARTYSALEKWAEAREVLKVLMSHDPTDALAWCLFARAALMSGDLETADEAVSTFNRRGRATPESLLLQALIARRRGNHRSAMDLAAEATRLDEGLSAAYWLRGLSARSLRDYEGAREAYAKARAVEPNSPLARAMQEDMSVESAFGEILEGLDRNDRSVDVDAETGARQ